LTPAQIDEIVYSEPDARARLILRIFYVAGLRTPELVALSGRHVFPDALMLPDRPVRIPTSLYRDIVQHRSDVDYVFSIQGRQVRRIVARAGQRVGLQLSPSMLRDAHAAHAIAHGCPLNVLQKTLGYRSLRSTSRHVRDRDADSSAFYLGGRS
jgi:integrase/recombinase XerD